jgi:DNA invertase Pin-like site-specific DNA recombinase
LLKITPDEESNLETIISKETKRQRDRERKARERRARGALAREDYLAQTRERNQYHRNQAKKLRAEGKSLRKIGEALGISPTQVSRLLPPGE